MEYAVNFGLILSELPTNFHKHYIALNNSPKLKISLKKCKKGILFEFEDNSIGIQPDIIDPDQPSLTYGIEMIKGLDSHVNGTLKINCSNGAKFSIRLNPEKSFKIESYTTKSFYSFKTNLNIVFQTLTTRNKEKY